MKVTLDIPHCGKCPFHEVRRDPDPTDWFNDDDEKVVCLRKKYGGQPKTITSMCRPYETARDLKSMGVPKWCPLRRKT